MRESTLPRWPFFALLLLGGAARAAPTVVKLADVIPRALSAEVQQDSEPSIAVLSGGAAQLVTWPSIAKHDLCAASDVNYRGLVTLHTELPVLVASDGHVFEEACFPSPGPYKSVHDITAAFGPSNDLFVGSVTLTPDGTITALQKMIMDPLGFTPLVKHAAMGLDEIADQPWVFAGIDPPVLTVNMGGDPLAVVSGRTTELSDQDAENHGAAVRSVGHAGTGRRYFGYIRFHSEQRRTVQLSCGRRPHPFARGQVLEAGPEDATVHKADLVVAREDANHPLTRHPVWRAPRDILMSGAECGVQALGNHRTSADVSLAVDPAAQDTIFVAWTEGATAQTFGVHVGYSRDGGGTWNDQLLGQGGLARAINPSVAIDTRGTVALLYQQYDGQHHQWITAMRFFRAAGAQAPYLLVPDPGVVELARTDEQGLLPRGQPYLGDFTQLVAQGTRFFGAFSANNDPAGTFHCRANAQCFHYERTVVNGHLEDGNGAQVAPSIDPFYVEVDDR